MTSGRAEEERDIHAILNELPPGCNVSGFIESAMALLLLTAAIRYGGNAMTVATHSECEVPGLGTVFFAFLIVTALARTLCASEGRAWRSLERRRELEVLWSSMHRGG